MTEAYDVEILLVEDNPYDAELALRAFAKHRLASHVVVVADGKEALDFLFARGVYQGTSLNSGPKVILLDLNLPKVDGHEVLKAIKSDPKLKRLPVIILTTSKEERDVVESYQLGANSYIVKPVDYDQFLSIIDQLGVYWLVLNEPPARDTPA